MSISDPNKNEIHLEEIKVPLIVEQRSVEKSNKIVYLQDELPDVELPFHQSSEQDAGLLNRLLFCFVAQYLWRTRDSKNDEDLLERPLEKFRAKNASLTLARVWEVEQAKGGSFFNAIIKAVGSKVAAHGVLLFLEEFIHLVQPLCMGRLMGFFRPGSLMSYEDAYYAAAGVAITALISPVIHHPYFHGLLKLGCELKVGTSTLLYQKGLKLSSSSVQHTSTGQLINLLSTDVVKFDMSFIFIHYVWLCPILLFAYGYVIWRELGAACIAGFVCLFFLIFTQGFFSSFMGINRRHIAERADKRLSVMNEIISGIRVIKMYAWEDAFAKIVENYRELEIQKVKLSSIFSAIVMGVFFTSGKIALLCALMVYIYLGNDITAERVFVASALYNSCRLPFSLFLPLGIHLLTELRTTATRIETFLNLKEFSRVTKTTQRGNKRKDKKKIHQALIEHPIDNKGTWNIDLAHTKSPKIEITNLYTLWMDDNEHKVPKRKWWKKKASEEEALIETQPCYGVQNVTFHARSGDCVAVVGQVGSGKSSFLSSILGEAKIMSGSLNVSGKIAYCSQEPWIFSGTVRDNILFGSEYEKEKYVRTVEICLLVQDFKQLANGDMSEVGDKGSTLSGGQRARVALARAVYSEADIYLLDDPLSAVDANVGKLLYKKLITEFLKDKLVILVTHQIQYLEDLPNVLLMKDSAIVGRGQISDLKRDFKDLFVSLGEDSNQEQEEKTVQRSVSRSSAKRTFSTASDRRVSFSECATPTDFVDTITSLIEEEDEEETGNGKNLNGNEERSTGSVPMSVYWAYIREVCNPTVQGVLLSVFVLITQVMFNFVDWWLNKWATSAEKWNVINANSTITTPFYDDYNLFGMEFRVDGFSYKWSFAILTIILSACGIMRCIWFRLAQIGASRRLHSKMFTAVVNTDVAFFDDNSVGRVLNRFSKDMGQVDDNIAFVFFEFIMGMLSFIGIVLVIVVLNPLVFIATIPMIIAFYFVRQIYIKRSRELKRIEATSRSPMNTHISATLAGLPTIRAYGKEREMLAKFFETHDINLAAFNMSLVTARWFAVCIDVLVACFITAVAFICVWQYSNLSSGEVALMLVYAVQLTGFFSWIMRQSAELQNGMVSVERIVEYTKLKSEYELRNLESHDFDDEKLGNKWPSDGRIKFEKVNVSYGGENVLTNLNFEIEPRQKIGIAGRTGAGKSTLLRVLFGLKDVTSGKIIIDHTDCRNLSLQYRRKGMAIIPQEPVLFIGTVRRNLDPFDEFDDNVLWDSLDQCELKEVVTEMGGLSAPMQEGGANFSVGQRQLVCLARALIHHAKILVIDEATANVDARTDAIIQKTLRIRFSNSTVLTIAHRLNTIMESDKIMVFENGHLVEFDTPKTLMDNVNSALWNLVAQAGSENAEQLRKIATDSHNLKVRNTNQQTSK